MLNSLEKLCTINGISGDEGRVRDYIISQVKDLAEYKVDNLGNVIVYKKGRNKPAKKLMISAHMDEVGGIVTYITDDGVIKFSTVGGVDPRVLFGRRVRVGKDEILGVIGGRAMHNLSKDEREKSVAVKDMFIDIGANSRVEVEEKISLGDSICFESDFVKFGDGYLKSKALDDRCGCAIMLDMIKSQQAFDITFTFVVQEEIGLRGATVAAFSVNPDFAIVLETTTAADIPSASEDKRVCVLGNGPVVSFMDRHTIYDKGLYNLAFEIAKENGIACQSKTMVAGGNDAGAIHASRSGVRTCAISLPCRYLHSPSCVIKLEDFESSRLLAQKLADRILKDDFSH